MIGGEASVRWGECPAKVETGCSGGCSGCPHRNPPLADLAVLDELYAFLGESLAWGALADRLGLPEGAELVTATSEWVASSPTLVESETGSLLSLVSRIGARAATAAPKAWARITATADAALVRLGKVPGTLLAGGVALVLGSAYLTSSERVSLSALAGKKALVGETLARLSPADAAAALRDLGALDAPAAGGLFGALGAALPWIVGGLALVIGLPYLMRLGRGDR